MKFEEWYKQREVSLRNSEQYLRDLAVDGLRMRIGDVGRVQKEQTPTPEIPMEFSIAETGFKCPICAVVVDKDATVVRCSICQTPAHKDCFEFNGKCGVFACGNKTSIPMICGPCEARHRDEQDPFRDYDALTYDYDYLHWRKSCPHYK